jgi:hypothetical protein
MKNKGCGAEIPNSNNFFGEFKNLHTKMPASHDDHGATSDMPAKVAPAIDPPWFVF